MQAGRRQHGARQVVVGDQHRDAELVRARHAFDARDAVIDGDQQVWRTLCCARGKVNDLWRQSIPVFEAVRHQVIDVCPHRTQSQQADRARGGAIAVVIGNDQQA